MIRLNLLDLWRSRRALLLTMVTLTVGFSALVVSLGVRDSQELLVSSKAREILTGDVQVSGTRLMEETELEEFKKIFGPTALSAETDILAAVRESDRAIMVELKAVTASYPLIGRIRVTSNHLAKFSELGPMEIWLADELREAFQLKTGQIIRLGEAQFKVSNWITADVGLRRGATGFAPRAYVRQEDLARTGLVQPGSQVQYRLTALLPPQAKLQSLIGRLENWPEDLVVRSPDDAIEGVKRGVVFVERYLALLTLFIMLLGFVSGFYLLQIHLRNRALTFALSLLFGAKPRAVEAGAIGQIFFLLCTSWFIALGVVKIGFLLLNPSLQVLLPSGSELVLGVRAFGVSALVLILNIIVFSLPFAVRLRRLEPQVLLDQSAPDLPLVSLRKDLSPYLLALLGYAGLSTWLLDSPVMAAAILAALLILVGAAGWGLPFITRRLAKRESVQGTFRLSLLGLARPRMMTTLMWLSLAWSACLSAAIPNLLAMAHQELRPPDRQNLPQLFVINLRGQDVVPLGQAVKDAGGDLRHVSPLILGRLSKRNGKSVTEERIARYPVRLTYRPELSAAEKVISGTPLPSQHTGDALPGVSVEREYAERNNLQLGDKLEFDVAGLTVNAHVSNLRDVQWNSFQPNFYIQFAGGVLDDFPKSFLGVIYGLQPTELLATQGKLSEKFPTLSLLNLATTLDRLSDLAGKLLWPILAVSGAGLLFILIMVSMLASHLWQEQTGERRLYHWLGATRAQIRQLFTVETLWLAGSALILGNLLGLALAIIGGYRVFDRWQVPAYLGLTFALALLSLFMSLTPQLWQALRLWASELKSYTKTPEK